MYQTPPLTDAEVAKRLKVKAGKTMYALTITIEDEFLQRIKNVILGHLSDDFYKKRMMRDYKDLKMRFFRSLNGI